MAFDFEKTFSDVPQSEMKIPKELAEQLSVNLPNGLKYEINTKNNHLYIIPDGTQNKIKIEGIYFKPTKKQLAILGKNFSVKDVLALAYNSQSQIPIVFERNNYIRLNEKEISISKLEYNPFKPYEIKLEKPFLHPPVFPGSFEISIGSLEKKINILVHRVPNESVNVEAYESDKKKCLYVKYFINPVTNQLSITMNIHIKNAKTVSEIVDAFEVYKAFDEGRGYITNELINTPLYTTTADKYNDEILNFWKKVLEIESKLKVEFKPPFTDLDYDHICAIEEIYQNVIMERPIRQNQCINSITSKWDFYKENAEKDMIGKPMIFEFEGNRSIRILGVDLKLSCLIIILNAVISDYKKNSDKRESTIYLKNESDDKTMFTSILSFKSKEDLDMYKDKNKNRVKHFIDAKMAREYL